MKKLLSLCLLAACELQPAPKQAPPAPTPAAGSGSAVAVAPGGGSAGSAAPSVAVAPSAGSAATGSGAGSGTRVAPAAPEIQATAECEKAAVRYAELIITAAPPSQRGIYEQNRANIVRSTEVACTQQAWSGPALACIEQAKADRDARACLDKFPPAGVKRPAATHRPQHD